MIKTTLIPQQTNLNILVPQNYIGKKIEVLLYAVDEILINAPKNVTMADFWNVISDETAQKLRKNVAETKDEWENDI